MTTWIIRAALALFFLAVGAVFLAMLAGLVYGTAVLLSVAADVLLVMVGR